METINKLSESELEIIQENRIKVRKEALLAQKARIDALLAKFDE